MVFAHSMFDELHWIESLLLRDSVIEWKERKTWNYNGLFKYYGHHCGLTMFA